MRIREISIRKLFGQHNHRIILNDAQRVTIIYGPNGVGKTTILRLVAHLFDRRFGAIRRVPFSTLTVAVDDGSSLSVTRRVSKADAESERPRTALVFNRMGPDGMEEDYVLQPLSPIESRDFPLNAVDSYIPSLERVGPREWLDRTLGDTLSFEDVVDRYGDSLPPMRTALDEFPGWLTSFLEGTPTLLIETQRLIHTAPPDPYASVRRGPTLTSTVQAYAVELAQIIQRRLAESAAMAQSLDRSFPSRLLKRDLPKTATPDTIAKKYGVQEQLRERLINAGLLDTGEEISLPQRSLDSTERKVLWTYLADTDKKLRHFSELLERIELFKAIINAKFVGKAVSIDKNAGFVFSQNDALLRPTDLSSGEQHEVVLAYQLLFQVRPDSLILIDEPEISLHVTWQHQFLEDVRRISNLVQLDFLIATHSPQIIHKSWELAVQLSKDR